MQAIHSSAIERALQRQCHNQPFGLRLHRVVGAGGVGPPQIAAAPKHTVFLTGCTIEDLAVESHTCTVAGVRCSIILSDIGCEIGFDSLAGF